MGVIVADASCNGGADSKAKVYTTYATLQVFKLLVTVRHCNAIIHLLNQLLARSWGTRRLSKMKKACWVDVSASLLRLPRTWIVEDEEVEEDEEGLLESQHGAVGEVCLPLHEF